jgi:hypothetical protein
LREYFAALNISKNPYNRAMRTLILFCILFSLILISCGGSGSSGDLVFYEVSNDSYSQLINQNAMPAFPNLKTDKTIRNNNYPIEIALYADGKFYYNLPTLGDGNGTWTQEAGYIKLYSERTLFDMYIEIKALDKDANEFGITFIDRFGPQAIKVDKDNFPANPKAQNTSL